MIVTTSFNQQAASMTSPSISIASIILVSLLFQCVASASENSIQQQQQKQQTQEKPSNNELMAQLLKLTATSETAAPATQTTGDQPLASALESLLIKSGKQQQKKQQVMKPRQKYNDEKAALKKKWHQYVDELIDLKGESLKEDKFEVNKPQARKRQLLTNPLSVNDDNQDDKLTLIMVKRKPQLVDLDGQESTSVNSNGLTEGSFSGATTKQQQQQHQPQRINSPRHMQSVLNDDFGVLREAIFSTNNHLGTNKAPKFGSEEQF